jgi:hypothetical protein
MKSDTNRRKGKVSGEILRLLRGQPGAQAQIARSVRRADGRRGVSRSLVTDVLAGRKKSARVKYAIIRFASALAKRRALQALARAELLGR